MILAVVIHELSHARVALAKGYGIEQMVLMPYGAVLSVRDNIAREDAVAIYIAGPAINALVALFIIAVWWLVPVIYSFTRLFVIANLSIALFNLLPIYPLDGAKIVLNICKDRMKALKVMKIAGIVISAMMFVLFIISAFININFTLGIISIFLLAGAVIGNEKERYNHLITKIPFNKNKEDCMKCQNIMIPDTLPLHKILKYIKPDIINTFTVIDKTMKPIKTLNEEEMRKIFENNDVTKRIGNILGNE